jgi:hypothetical protein
MKLPTSYNNNIIVSIPIVMEVLITDTQYLALNAIYGPPEDVHYLILLAERRDKGWLLEGEEHVFESLLSTISEEIGEGLCSNTNASRLLSICKKIDPSSLDWIGM